MSPALAHSTFIRPEIDLGYTQHKNGVKTLPELIEYDALHNPDHTFGVQNCSGEDVSPHIITFSQLQSAVEFASWWLIASGCTTGRTRRDERVAPVGILLGSDIGIFIYMAALLRIGTPVLLLSSRLTPVAIAHLLKETSPSVVLISSHVARSSKEALGILRSEAGTILPTLLDALGYEQLLKPKHKWQDIQVPPVYTQHRREDLDAIIMHSSGTTGLPKPIFHGQAYPLIYAACHRLPEQQEPFRFNVSTLPLYHGFGLLAPALSLSVGMPFILPPASTIPTAKYTLMALQSNGARYLFSVPSILEELLRLPNDEGLEALASLEIVASGGAPMKECVGNELSAAGVNLLNHWGCTELGAIAPIEKVPPGYDWHYLMPRSDIDLQIIPLDNGSKSYRLVGCPPGWRACFEVQDLLMRNPKDHNQYRIMGRTDDLLVLSTGEKVRPTSLELAVAEHPDVKDVLAFGAGQFCLGLLVELGHGFKGDLNVPETLETLLASINPYLEHGNSFTDQHGKVSSEMIIFTREDTKPFARTDKGSLARKTILTAFDPEIKACYERVDLRKASPLPSAYDDDGYALLNCIRSLVQAITHTNDIPDTLDFFESGMDSLQASRLRRSIQNSLRVTPNLPNPIPELEPNFCFEHSSVEKLHRAVAHIISGSQIDSTPRESRRERRIQAMEDMVEKYRDALSSFSSIAAHSRISRKRRGYSGQSGQKNVVLLTGSTGSLGCFLLSKLANDPKVSKVICLNRRHIGIATHQQRQAKLMEKRGALMSTHAWDKVVLHGGDLSRADFGLCQEQFAEVRRHSDRLVVHLTDRSVQLLEVTHIVHNAWPINFNRSLSSFEPHVRGLCNLIGLALLSAGNRSAGSAPTRLLFASSIAVVGLFPRLHSHGPFEVPETPLGAENVAEFGYPEAKWVCEQLLLAADELFGGACSLDEPLLQGSNVRIGQMTGAEGSGAWNESEHFPIMVRTSQQLGALPALEGVSQILLSGSLIQRLVCAFQSLSWLPVNRAGDVLTELLFSKAFRPFYHVENPSRQSWSGIISNLASILGGAHGPMISIPLQKWLARVRGLGEDPVRNPAYKIIAFLERDFVPMSNGTVILRTSRTRLDSPTMIKSTAVDKKHLEEYVSYWRSVET
ncbi:putative NRPS-like protein biosynthetic cluster [Sphagnurus paluster]|uniref:NRPS-like protein biosynthetic cluster n=1 Tax=Sphagnurus paluster TaxID=117069 RepID=A0A9P7FUK4_9AGAR|nr:putative NRPS-like protein biosynthetic cluster [Sphagnurus paluster]